MRSCRSCKTASCAEPAKPFRLARHRVWRARPGGYATPIEAPELGGNLGHRKRNRRPHLDHHSDRLLQPARLASSEVIETEGWSGDEYQGPIRRGSGGPT